MGSVAGLHEQRLTGSTIHETGPPGTGQSPPVLTLHQRRCSRARIPDARCCSRAQSTQPRLAAKRARTICTQPISAMNMGNGTVAAAPLCANRSVPTNT